ncbi:MAG: ThuA domain-containing protein [Luteolibacter sp.]
MKVLVLIDDLWHPGAIPREGLAGLGDFDWIEDGRDWSAEKMSEYPVVVLVKANNVSRADKTPWVDDRVGEAFREYVEQGGGLFVVHSGGSGYDSIASMRGLPAGGFAHHPPQCPVTVVPEEGHPLCKDVELFTETDEHYFMHFDDPAADVFLHSISEHGTQPAGWTRTVGKGRVCMLTPGHNLSVWLTPSFQQLLRNGLAWVSNR